MKEIKNRLGEPNHDLGYTETELMRRLTGNEMKDFMTWMHGQTYAVDEGEPIYYTWDVKRYFEIVPGKEVWD